MDQVFGVEVHDEDGLLRVAVRGEVDMATAPQLRESLYDAVDRSEAIATIVGGDLIPLFPSIAEAVAR